MKKICFAFNHFQFSDGVARAALGIANHLAEKQNMEITLRPIFLCDQEMVKGLSQNIKVEPVFKFYFRGLSKVINMLPDFLLHKLVFRKEYDIEIGFQYGTATVAAGSYGKGKRAKHFIWIHTYDDGLKFKRYYLKADKVICVSKCNAERFEKETKGKIPVAYCYNAINDEAVRESANEMIELKRPNVPLFVSVGRHSPEKGYLRLLDCLYKLKKDGFSFKVWLIGNGPQHNELIEYSKKLELEEEVIFLGEKQNPHAYTSKADVFLCPSYAEGYSTACTEAIMLGVPVITTCVSGGKEIIEDAECGMLTEMDDISYYNALKYILQNPQLVDEWKETLKKTRERFSYKTRISKLDKILEI